MTAPNELIDEWLRSRLTPQGMQWLRGRREEVVHRYSDRALHITIGMIPRRLGKQDLALHDADVLQAKAARTAWDPRRWSVADAARIVVLLDSNGRGNQTFAQRFVDLCRNADVGELNALYRGLPLYPGPAELEDQAGEGLRSNMRSVFEAVAHNNPFPREQFSMDRWNQMVLKALFIGSSLAPIQGLDEMANPELASILCDYAHERWAAKRDVSPELWRCVGPFARGPMLDDLSKVLSTGSHREQVAAALALRASPDPEAERLLAAAPELVANIDESGC